MCFWLTSDGNVRLGIRLDLCNALGLTKSTIAGLFPSTSGTADDREKADVRTWIDTQMAIPATLHRAYYRKRANPRLPQTAPQTGGPR